MNILKQSTAVDVLIGPFVDSTDGDTEETGLTLASTDVKLSKNGQTMAGKNDATACAHDANGMYNCELDATDTNTVGTLVLFVHETGSLAVRHEFQVIEEAVYDALFGASAAGFASVADLATVDSNVDTLLTDLATVDGNVDAILADTAELQTNQGDWATATGFATSAALATVDGNVDAILVDTGTTLPASIAGLNDLSAADVNAEVVDALNVDTYAEPGQGAPGATISLAAKINYLYKSWRNKKSADSDSVDIYNDAGDTVDHRSNVTDDGTTTTRGEMGTGA